MADAAQLKLQVGLDLAFFRQQLALLGTTATNYSLPINIDRLGIQKEITKLGKNISGRKYTLKITSDVSGINADISKLQKALESIGKESVNIQVTGTGSLTVKEARKIRTDLKASILANGGKIKVPATITAAIAKADITAFKNAVKDKLDGVSVNVSANVKGGGAGAGLPPDYMKYMTEQGLLGKTARGMTMQMGKSGDDIKQQLNDAVQSAEKIKSVFDGVAQSIATTGKSIATIQGKRLGLANVPLMAGGVEKRIGQSATAIGGTTSFDALKALYPEVSKTITSLAALKGQIQQNTSKLSGFSLIIALAAFAGVPLAKSVVKLTGSADNFAQLLDRLGLKLDAAFTKAASNILNAASSRLLGEGSVAGLLPPAYRGIQPSAGAAGLLPPAYRGIGPSRNAGAIGGTAFGSQKYLPTALGNETKKVLRDAAYVFLDTIKQGIREVRIQDLGKTINSQAMLSGRNIAGLLPPGVGRVPNAYTTGAIGGETQTERFARREKEARIRSSFREMDVMGGGGGRPTASYNYAYRAARPTSAIVPYGPGGALVAGGEGGQPPTPPSGGRGGSSGFGGFANAMAGIKLPGAGLVSELGDQFGYAAKQVLLFGTTYRALAFLTDFPAKVGEAVAQLQSFRNTLQAITPNADEFQKSNQFILDTVDKYNIPIQSARDGFTKLYASMEPAGFSGEQIQKLFLGISKASATLGLSSDKVDRVTYAFSQMASKGQLMSEEVSGQLGDVIPGALSIMAKAANMDIKTFKKAMEDGVFVGKAFTDVMSNVPIVLDQRFGKGAEGAAKTFQSQMNAMATATQMLYESFVPVGDLFTSKIVAPFTKELQVLADGFNAFFSGAATKTAGGSALFQELEKLRPTFKGIADNIKQLLPLLQSFATTALGLGKILLQIAGNPFAGYLARVYLAVLPLTMAIQALNLQALVPMIASFVRAIPAFIAYQAALLQGVSANKSLQLSMVLTGQSAGITAGKIRLVGAALGSLAVGGIVLGIGVLIERFMSLGAAIDGVHQATKQTVQGISSLANTGDVGGLKNILADTKKQVETFKGLRQFVSGGSLGAPSKQLTQSAANQMKALGLERFVSNDVFGEPYVNDFINASKLIEEKLKGLEKTAGAVQQKLPLAVKIAENIKQQAKKASDAIAPIPGAGGDETLAKAVAAALANQQALADKLSADQTKTNIERQTALFENEKSMINMAYDLREARANSFQKETIRFQKELFNIEMKKQKAVLDANSAVTKAQGSIAGGLASTSGFIDKSVLQKWMESQGFGRTTGNFANKGHATPNHMLNAMDMGIIGGSDADALRKTKAMEERLRRTGAFGNQLFGPTKDPMGHGAGKGGGNIHLHIPTPGGKVPMTPGLAAEMNYSGASSTTSAGGKPSSHQKKIALANQQTQNALQNIKVKTTLAEAEALKEAEIAMVNYISSIAPVAEQDLQNQLLGKRIELMQSGAPEAFAETQMKIFEAQEKTRMAGEQLDLTNQKQVEAYEKLKQSLPGYIALLEDAAVKQQQLGFTKTMKNLGDRAAMARALTPEAEMRTRLQQQGYAGTQLETLFETEKTTAKAEQLKTQMQGVASTIGDAFSTAFQGIINGSMSAQDALAGMFQSIGQSFVKMAMDMIAQQITMITLGFIMKALGLIGGIASAGNAAGAAAFSPGNAAGLDAIPGQAFNLPQLSGTMMNGSEIGAKAFAGPLAGGFAKGGAFSSGVRRFATGGIVNGPTLFPFADGGTMQMGLMGEAGPEAIMPLQRGADGSLGVRAAMGSNGMGGSSSPILNMSFETSTINGVEYVSRDQLEAAMAQTRRQASSDGAKRGMAMTLDKIQQSPQTRRRIGM